MTPKGEQLNPHPGIPDLGLDTRREVIKQAFADLRHMDTPIYALMVENLKEVEKRIPRPDLTLGVACLERVKASGLVQRLILGQGDPWFIGFDGYFAGQQVGSEVRDRRAAQVGSVIVWMLERRIAESASANSRISVEWTGSGAHHIIVRTGSYVDG